MLKFLALLLTIALFVAALALQWHLLVVLGIALAVLVAAGNLISGR